MTHEAKAAPSLARPFPYVKANLGTAIPVVNSAGRRYAPIPAGGAWSVDPIWVGPIFVIAGGPSVATANLELIRGRRVIAVNSSYEAAPWADIVYFGDARWWEAHKKILTKLKGHLVTVSGVAKHPRLLKLKRIKPRNPETGFCAAKDSLASQRTSLQGAINLAYHLGGNPIVLLGADMGRASDGRSHHHKPHKWSNRPGNVTWDEQMRHLRWIVKPLADRNIRVVNCSMTSRIPWWPKMTLEEYLASERRQR